MDAPVGILCKKDRLIPTIKPKSERSAAKRIVERKFLQTRIAVMEGNTIKLEISKVPIMRIPSTMVMEVRSARTIL